MSVFVNKLKTFTSDILGEEKEFKINNAVWVYLESDYELNQLTWAEDYENNIAIYGSYFLTSVLKANGYEVTFNEVIANTDLQSISQFIQDYQMAMFGIENISDGDKEVKENKGE